MPINRNKRTRYMKLVEMAHNEDIEEILKRLYLDEQNNILEEIDRRVSRIDEQIRCENESISVLFELRTRLISDVVTGQIDVRGIEVPDFDIVEEIDSEDENLDDEDAAEETEEQEE